MFIIVTGLSHKTAPVEIREKLSFPAEQQGEALGSLLKATYVSEGLILSTCNRTEIYVVASELGAGKKEVVDFLCRTRGLTTKDVEPYLYFHDSESAIQHLFRVASSLDSMVIGEAQILGQVKEAFSIASDNGSTSIIFNKLFNHAIMVGKKVRTETEIGESAVSISYAAVELAKTVFEDLAGRTVMILGAGKMSELTAKHLQANGITSILVTNRTFERAVDLAEKFKGKAVRFDEFTDYMVYADIVVCSTGATAYVLNKNDVTGVMRRRKNKPIFIIDISVPRNIDPEVGDAYNVYLYDIDDLQSVVNNNLTEREKEAEKADFVVDREIREFMAWMGSREVVPTIAALREKVEEIRLGEVEDILNKLSSLDERERNLIMALSSAIVNKLLHDPLVRLKECSDKKDGYVYIESLRHLFALDEFEKKKK